MRSIRLTSLENIPKEVRGTAIFSWHDNLPLLRLVELKGSFILIDEDDNHHKNSKVNPLHIATAIVEKYQQCSLRRKEAVVEAHGELLNSALDQHAAF